MGDVSILRQRVDLVEDGERLRRKAFVDVVGDRADDAAVEVGDDVQANVRCRSRG